MILDTALQYAARGWYVLPLKPKDKVPLTPNGVKDATTDPETIRRWWARWPNANIGIACGPSRLLVVDLDGPEALTAWADLAQRLDIPYRTLTAHTGGGGIHLFYRVPDGLHIGNSAGRLGPHIDTRGEGGYVVAPPSIHPSGRPYTWEDPDREILELPQPLANLLTRPKPEAPPPARQQDLHPYAEAALREEVEAVRRALEGTRNNTLNKAAFSLGQLVGAGILDRQTVEVELAAAARAAGLEEREIQATIRSGLEAGMRQPRILPERKSTRWKWNWPPPPEPPELQETLLDIGTEAWLGQRASTLLSSQVAFVPQWGWMVWDGKKWVRDAGMQKVRQLALQALTRDIARMISDAAGNEEEVKKLTRILQSTQRRTTLDNALIFAESWTLTEPDRFDQHPYLLNTPSGVVNLRNGEVLPHQPDLYLTQITRVPYDPEATAPRFLRFLEEIFGGNERLISFVHRLLGYGLLGHNQERIFAIFWGKGKNGKSTLCRILEGVLGDYLKEARPESLESLRAGEIRPRNDLAVLRGARLVTFNESREGAKFDPALIKQIAGGTDLITVRYLYREDFSYRPAFLPILRTNHKPHFPGGDPALWDRIRLVPFTVEIPPERQEKDLAERILAEEGPGVLAWLVRGCLAYQEQGLGEPAEVQEATQDYRMETDPVWAFVCECCEQDPQAREETGKLYAAFTSWWTESGMAGEPISQTWFSRTLTNFGFAVDRHRTHNRRLRIGIRLRE